MSSKFLTDISFKKSAGAARQTNKLDEENKETEGQQSALSTRNQIPLFLSGGG